MKSIIKAILEWVNSPACPDTGTAVVYTWVNPSTKGEEKYIVI
jgi:hypothetical protein